MAHTDKPNTDTKGVGEYRRVAGFEIHHIQCLNHQGEVLGELPEFAENRDELLNLYRNMVLTRTFDTKAIALQRTGKMGTYASSLGQEAVSVAIGAAMRADDVLLPAYREYGAQFQRGVAMHEILLYWGGDERGMCFADQPHDFPICVPIASQVPHAAGVAYAMKLREEARAAVCVLGDGATSKGDFYEALNVAGAWQLPMVVVVTNNQWAISLRREAQTHAETLAQKGIAAGVPGIQVDGNDIIAMRYAMGEALEQAYHQRGPTLIEALTYRMSDHTTADDASRYRSAEEVERQKQYDPILRLRNFLMQRHGWSESDDQALADDCAARVDAAVKRYLDTPPQPPESMFDHLYAELPRAYRSQRDEVANRGGSHHG